MKIANFKSVLVLLVGIVGIPATVFAAIYGWRYFTKAEQSSAPVDVRVSNVSDSSAAVSFTTDKAVLTTIMYGQTADSLGQSLLDHEAKSVHYFELKNLQPATTYYYKLGTSSPDSFTTAPISVVPPTPDETYGKVVDRSSNPAKKVTVYIKISDNQQDSSLLSALTDDNGNYALDLGNARSQDLKSYFRYSRNSGILNVDVAGADLGKALVKLSTAQSQQIPTITLGSGGLVDLTSKPLTAQQTESQKTRTEQQTVPAPVTGLLSPPVTSSEIASAAAQIAKPKINIPPNSVLQPGQVVWGTASPGETLTIVFHSALVSTTVTADQNGNWTVPIPQGLDTGTHTMEVSSKAGTDSVAFVLGTTSTTHRICQNRSCVLVEGTGIDNCASDVSCQPVATPPQIPKSGNTSLSILIGGTGLFFLIGGLFLLRLLN